MHTWTQSFAVLASGLALCGAAAAQQPSPATGAAPPDPTLATVTVTASPGVAQTLFDTPASVDVVSGQTLRNAQLQVNLSEALPRVPGLVVQNRQNYAQDLQISIRGFGARSTFGVRGLRLYADGIPATAPDGQGQVSHFDLASAERIEVLRGPFSALYGNASGGVISLFTADGGPDTVAEVSGAAGPDGMRRGTVQLSGAQGRLTYRLSGTRFETDGWRTHAAARRETFNAKLTLDGSEDRESRGPRDAGRRWTFVLNRLDMPETQDPLGLTRAQWQQDARQGSPQALQFDTRKSVGQFQGGAAMEQRLGGGRTLQLSAHAGERETVQFQAIPVAAQSSASQPGGVIDLHRRYRGLDGRIIQRGRTPAGPYTLTAGLAYEATTDQRRGWENFAGATLGVQGSLRRDEENQASSLAPYAQGQWVLGEHFSATAGLRHSRIRMRSQDRYIQPGNPDDSGSVRYAATTPALGLVWHAREDVNLYVSYGRGFETPTLNELAYRADGTAGLNADLDAARSHHWELGAKAEREDWSAQAALFHARTRDEIVVLANTGGRSSFQNAPGSRRSGLELAATGRLPAGFSVQFAATWIQATYEEDFLTCTGTPCLTPATRVDSGRRLPGIPPASLFAELAWRHAPWGFETALEFRAIGRVFVDDLNTDAAPGYGIAALRAGWQQRHGHWTFREFVRVDNLGDRRFAGSVIVNEGNRRYFEPSPGRQWLLGASAAYRF
jgi:iron complex outermembrane recepter protein